MLHRLKILFTVIATCLFAAGGYAAEYPAEPADTTSESLASDISAWLVISHRGPRFISSFGHCSIHMSCPSAGLDNYYTYLVLKNARDVRMFFTYGFSRGFYTLYKWDEFAADYIDQHRTITEYRLNLNTDEVRNLWKNLDREAYNPSSRMYSFLHSQCASISADVISRSLCGEHIVYDNLPPALTGTTRDFALHATELYPWYQFVFMCLLGREGEQFNKTAEMLSPTLIVPTWKQASIVDTAGHSRPVLTDEEREMYKGDFTHVTPNPFTPVIAFALVLALIVILTLMERLGKCHRCAAVVDGVLLGMLTLVGCLITYLCFFSQATWGPGNALLPVFNPLPFVLWLILRRKRCFRWLCAAYTAVIAVMMVAAAFIPQLGAGHVMLFAIFLVRAANRTFPMNKPTNK